MRFVKVSESHAAEPRTRRAEEGEAFQGAGPACYEAAIPATDYKTNGDR